MSNKEVYMKYVYKRIQIKTLLEEPILNKMGEAGWRLVSVLSVAGSFTYYFVKEEMQCLYLNDGEIMELEDE